jgi:ABC-type nitrate/sulfonate/bicarbonate transport system substrate-binding protein
MKGDSMASAEKILSFGLSVVLLVCAFKASSFAQGRPVKTYVSHAAATLTDVPYYIAREKRFYLDEGLDVTSIFVQGRALSIQVLTAGSVDFSLATGSGTRAALTGAPVKAIFVLNDKPFYVLYGRPDLGVQKGEDLRGKKIAVTGVGAMTELAARAIVTHFGLNADKDVHILAIGGGTSVWSAIQSGAVEAAILWPPFDVVANKMGMKKLLFVGDLIKLLGGGVMATDQVLRDNPDRAKRFLRATLRGMRYFTNEKNRSDNVAIMSRVFQLDQETILGCYDFLRSIQTTDGTISRATMESAIDIALQGNRDPKILALSKDEQIRRMFDFSLAREILKEEAKTR